MFTVFCPTYCVISEVVAHKRVKLQRNSQFVLSKSGCGLLREVDLTTRGHKYSDLTERQNGALRSGRA